MSLNRKIQMYRIGQTLLSQKVVERGYDFEGKNNVEPYFKRAIKRAPQLNEL